MNEYRGVERRKTVDCRSQVEALRMVARVLMASNLVLVAVVAMLGWRIADRVALVEDGLRQHIEMAKPFMDKCHIPEK